MEQERHYEYEDYVEKDFSEFEREERIYSQKSYAIAVTLSAIFGILGIQHFYLERWFLGIFDLSLSITGFILLSEGHMLGLGLLAIDAIHTLIVTYKLFVGEFKDGHGKIVAYPGQKK